MNDSSTSSASTSPHLPKKFTARYVFNDTISRIAQFLSNQSNIIELNMKTPIPYLFTNKPDNNFFTYTLGEKTSYTYNHIITWILENKSIATPIIYVFHWISNTWDNTTLLLFELVIEHPWKIGVEIQEKVRQGCLSSCEKIINEIEAIMQDNNENLLEFQSIVINVPKGILWNYLITLTFLTKEAILDPITNGNIEEVGTLVSWQNKITNINYLSKIKEVDKTPEKQKWVFSLSSLEGHLQEQDVVFTIISISNNRSFFSISHEFKEHVDKETINACEKGKKEMWKDIKKEIEIRYEAERE